MPKIAIIGAGSIVFTTTFMNDLLSTECLQGATYALMGPTRAKLEKMENYVRAVIRTNGLPANVYSTTDRREALKDADYVIAVLQIGGIEAWGMDYDIPLKYGVDQCIGDCLGPGGVFRALRTIPVMVDLVRDMEEVCPKAVLLNYVNPMAPVCIALGRSSRTPFVGLCHGVQTTLDLIAGYLDLEKQDIQYLCAGINHMAWFLKLEKDGRDLYPQLRERIEKPEYYMNEKVRCEVMRNFGYFMTESSGHLSEYLAWFRKNRKAMDLYCDVPDFGGESGAAYKGSLMIAGRFSQIDIHSLESDRLKPRSKEYCSYIIEALETGKPFRFNGNVMNHGYIDNLPSSCCVEVPVVADKTGLAPVGIGSLPLPLAAMNQSNVAVQQLMAEAALTGDPELAFSAVAMDPLTAAVLTLKEIRDMTIELFEAQKEYLPQFKGRLPRRLHTVSIPEGTVPVNAPVDPALAVVNRLARLGGGNE